jgi:FkbM family methyltransferase
MPTDWNPKKLKKFGFNPKTIIDVGAGSGTTELFKVFPEAYYVLIEPLKEYEQNLQSILKKYKGEYFLTAIGNKTGRIEINVEPGFLERTSIKEPSKLTLAVKGETVAREIPITTLDALQKKHQFRSPFGLKIDTEGYDLQVVKGARELLYQTEFVIAEVSVAKRFEDSYSFAEFIGLMDKNNFALCEILYAYRRSNKLIYVDCLFVRKEQV